MTTIINNTNKKFAVLVAINYTGTTSALNGCINDANHLKTFLMEKCGYLPENIMMLADDNINVKPTKQNIINSFATLVSKAKTEQFNELWFSYSGHGSYVSDLNGDENDYCDEVLCPLDYSTAGMIDDDFIYTNLVAKLPSTATLFALSDSCHSGTVFDLPYLYTTSLINNNNKNTHVANVISISGCRDNQTSADAYIAGKYEGAMTWSFLNALSNTGYNVKISDLLAKMRTLLLNNYTQVPQLALSISTDLDRYFMQPTTTTVVPIVSPEPITKLVNFNIKVDYWYKESTWNVWSVADNKYVFATDNTFIYKYQSMNISKVLPVGTYKLCIKDSYGDGGVTSKVTCGLVTLVSGNMMSGKLAEYTFTF
jgi:hypothetical protein